VHPRGGSPKLLGDLALHAKHDPRGSGRCRVRHQDGTEEWEEWDKPLVGTANFVGGASRKKVVEGQAGGVGRKDGADVGCGEGTVVGGGPRAHCRQSRAVPKMTTSVAEYSTCWWTDE